MSEQCPVTITVHEYYTQNFIAKVAKKECKVSVPGYAGSWIEDVEDVRGMYFVKFQDHEGQHSFNFEPDDKLTVYWLPQPEREEAAAREFADGWRDAEIARLTSELEAAKVEMDLRGEFLGRVVDIRSRLIDQRSNSWLDSIDAIGLEIARLQAEVARLREALKPFAEAAKSIVPVDIEIEMYPNDQLVLDENIIKVYGISDTVTIGDFLNANAALGEPDHK